MIQSCSGRKASEQEERAACDVRADEDPAPVEAVHEHAGDRAEDDGGHEEREQQDAHRRARVGQAEDLDGQPEEDHVAADLGQDLRREERHEARVREDPARAAEVAALDRDESALADLLRGPRFGCAQCSVGARLRGE